MPMSEGIQYPGTVSGRWSGSGDGGDRERKSNTVFAQNHVVMTGNFLTGFYFYGPFRDLSAASKWVSFNLKAGAKYEILPMNSVKEA